MIRWLRRLFRRPKFSAGDGTFTIPKEWSEVRIEAVGGGGGGSGGAYNGRLVSIKLGGKEILADELDLDGMKKPSPR